MAESLKEKTAKGLFWSGINNGAMQLLNLIFGIVTSRILNDTDYGMIGMLSIFSLIAASLQESGFTSALANKKEIRHEDYNAVFWFSSAISVTLYLILFFCAPLIADFYDNENLIPLARYAFLGFVISSLGISQNAYLFRNLMVKQKTIASISGLAVSGIVGIIMACLGCSYWSIATQSIVYISVLNICLWSFSPWRPTLKFSFKPLKGMINFSAKLMITNIFNHINNNLFSIILGKYYSEKEVGQFNQANKWNYMGHSFISSMVGSVAQPMFNQVGSDLTRQQRVFRKMLRFTAFIAFPSMLGLSFIAPELITITITAKWLPSAHILQILAIGGAFIPITALYSNLIISKGKSNIFMWNTITLGILQLIAMLILSPYGLKNMLTVYVAINIGWLFVWHYFVSREIKLSLWAALKDVVPYAGIALLAIAAAYFITGHITDIYLLILTKITVTAILYGGLMWICGSETFKESLSYLLKKTRKK